MHILITLISNKALLKPKKTGHHWTPQLIRSTKSLFGVCRVNETKVTGAYLQCGRSESFSLLKLTLFLVTLMDIETKLFLDQSGRQW